jgi:hypothetical protein
MNNPKHCDGTVKRKEKTETKKKTVSTNKKKQRCS